MACGAAAAAITGCGSSLLGWPSAESSRGAWTAIAAELRESSPNSPLRLELQFIEFDHNLMERGHLQRLAAELNVWRFTVIQGSSCRGWDGTEFTGTQDEHAVELAVTNYGSVHTSILLAKWAYVILAKTTECGILAWESITCGTTCGTIPLF